MNLKNLILEKMTEAKVDLAVKLLFGAFVLITTFLIILYMGGILVTPPWGDRYRHDATIIIDGPTDGPLMQKAAKEAIK